VLWWVPVGHRPSVEEAVTRIKHLKEHSPGANPRRNRTLKVDPLGSALPLLMVVISPIGTVI
jgi:hypothetical protein